MSGSRSAAPVVTGNVYDKYRTRNPLYRALMASFQRAARELLAGAAPQRVLEVGCGPGDLAAAALDTFPGFDGAAYVGCDIGLAELATARRRAAARFAAASAYRLPFADRSFDTVLAAEVLEHLTAPEAALAEIARVASGRLLVSVPWEPVWRLLNVARGQYLGSLGNTPGHVQQFGRQAIRELVGRRFRVVAERRPFPWTMLLAVPGE